VPKLVSPSVTNSRSAYPSIRR